MLDGDDWLVEGRGKTGWTGRRESQLLGSDRGSSSDKHCTSEYVGQEVLRHWSSFSFFSLRELVETFLHDGQLKQENNIVAWGLECTRQVPWIIRITTKGSSHEKKTVKKGDIVH